MKKMYKKAIVAILIFVAVYIVSVVAAYKFKNGNMDWGNASDILSSLSTFGTFLVAFGAFLKAPDWIKQRKYEDGFALGRELITETIPTLCSKIDSATVDTYVVKEDIDLISESVTEITTQPIYEKNLQILKAGNLSLLAPMELIRKLRRFGWHIEPDAHTLIKEMIKQAQQIRRIHNRIWIQIRKCHNDPAYDKGEATSYSELIKLMDRLTVVHGKFMALGSKFDGLYSDVDDYFKVK